ncbi:hypothetical protein ACJJTC_012822 [Scirpophaga incertulas]
MLTTYLLTLTLIHIASCNLPPKVLLNNGIEMPALALGTFLGFQENGVIKSKDKEVRNAILSAIDNGYRHIDTAEIYDNEQEIGEAIKDKIDLGDVKREDMFITTKLWNTHHRRDQVVPQLRESLQKLDLKYIDLYLMHWPLALNDDYSFSDVDYLETWRGMEDAYKQGLAKAIGIANFNKEQIERLLNNCEIKPAVMQMEMHPQLIQTELIEYLRSKNITAASYSLLGALVPRSGLELPGPKLDEPVMVSIGRKYNKTTVQVVLRWAIQKSVVPVIKSFNSIRQAENINIYDFKLEQEDLDKINQFNSNTRFTLPSFWQNHPHYPFDKIEKPIEDPFVKKT